MGGSPTIHLTLALFQYVEYNRGITCTQNTYIKYQYEDGQIMFYVHLICLGIFVAKHSTSIFLKKSKPYLQHFYTIIQITIYMLSILFTVFKLFTKDEVNQGILDLVDNKVLTECLKTLKIDPRINFDGALSVFDDITTR